MRVQITRHKKGITLAVGAIAMLVIVGALILNWMQTDGPPPTYQVEMLSIYSEVEKIRDRIAQYRIENKSFNGIKAHIDTSAINNRKLISKIEVDEDGAVTVNAMLTAKQGGNSSDLARIPITIRWRPNLDGDRVLGWLCKGEPEVYMLGNCKPQLVGPDKNSPPPPP